jgi:rhamnogalacturonan endolyase
LAGGSLAAGAWAGLAVAAPDPAGAKGCRPAALRPVAVPAEGGVHLSWRADPCLPRGPVAIRRDGQVVARITGASSWLDRAGTPASTYRVGPDPAGIRVASAGYLAVPLDRPAPRTTPDGQAYGYTANDGAVGDVDGDGRPEILVKWTPEIARDNAFGGYTGETLIDAYTLDGRRLWRIDLGRNIRSGAHYTQMVLADFDGDGRAELMLKTGDGTVDGTGAVLGQAAADWRERGGELAQQDRTGSTVGADGRRMQGLAGRILSGPEYVTVFDGLTGRALASAPYAPTRFPDGSTGRDDERLKTLWGDAYGNRAERYLAGVAWLDGRQPSAIMARGYYARTTVAAWDWRGGKLTRRWLFDSATPGQERNGGQGNHQFSVADVDGDGRDEIVYGSLALDDDGKVLWNARLGHGDALHVSDFDPAHPGLERFGVHEDVRGNGGIGSAMIDAATGKVLWTTPAQSDTGRGICADIDAGSPGAECWSSNETVLRSAAGKVIAQRHPRAANFAIWWDGDATRELLDGTRITKWDPATASETRLFDPPGTAANNGTKANPVFSGDILGDWREELVLRTPDSSELRIYATPWPTCLALAPLDSDRSYRAALVWQNNAYNQPPHPAFDLSRRAVRSCARDVGPARRRPG